MARSRARKEHALAAGTWESHHAITQLLFRYAEAIDAADFEALGELFAEGQIRSSAAADPSGALRGDALPAFYAATNKVHPDGTLRTRHLTTNVRIEIDEAADEATSRASYLVLQATPKLPLQAIVAGRYEDRFLRVAGRWRFADRLIHVDQVGDLSEHLSEALGRNLSRERS